MFRSLHQATPNPAERMRRTPSLGDANPVPLSRGSTRARIVMDLARNQLYLSKGAPRRDNWTLRPGV